MESKEALKRINLAPVCECDDYDGEPYIVGTVEDSFENDIKIIEKDLDKLEKYDKAIEIIKRYAVNDGWSNGWVIKFWEMNSKELDLLKEVFG